MCSSDLLPAAFLLGALVGVFEFPCTGGPYLMVLGFLHDEATRIAGFGYLIIYNIIFIIPLIVILLIASDKALLDKVQSWKKGGVGRVRFWSGLAMVALGLFMFTL